MPAGTTTHHSQNSLVAARLRKSPIQSSTDPREAIATGRVRGWATATNEAGRATSNVHGGKAEDE